MRPPHHSPTTSTRPRHRALGLVGEQFQISPHAGGGLVYLGSPLGIRTPAKRRRSWSERGCAENGPGGTRRGRAAAATRRGAGAGARRAPARRVHRRPLCGAARGVFVPGGYLCFFFFCGRGAPPGRRGPREAAACTTDGPLGRFACAERVGGRPPMVARRARLWMGRVLPRRPRRAPPLAIPAREQLGSPPLCPRLWRQHDVSGGGCLDRRGLWQRVPAWSPQSAPRCPTVVPPRAARAQPVSDG